MKKSPTPIRGVVESPLVARWYLAQQTGRHPETVARRCRPVACDVRNRSLLYDVDEAIEVLGGLRLANGARHAMKNRGTFPGGEVYPEDDDSMLADDPEPWEVLLGEDVPPPVMLRLALAVRNVRRWGFDVTTERFECMYRDLLEEYRREASRARIRPKVATVYYIRLDSLIKIGQTTNVRNRLQSYPPHATLLATEQGEWGVLEAQRLAQFAASRAYGREWFEPSVELIAHINSLRSTPLSPEELAA